MLSLRVIPRSIAGRSFYRPLSSGNTQEKSPASKPETDVEGFKPIYATKSNYDIQQMQLRRESAGMENGQRPTKWQKRFLVVTKLYKNQAEIPEYVQNGTMNRMHDRMRVVFIVVGCLGFFTVFYIGEQINVARIDRDRAAGKVVTKM